MRVTSVCLYNVTSVVNFSGSPFFLPPSTTIPVPFRYAKKKEMYPAFFFISISEYKKENK